MLDDGINATTCTSSFYCPPSTLIPVTRELAGNTYTFLQFWQLFPWTKPFYTPFEKNFDVRPWFMFVHGNWWLPVVAIALYGVMIVTLPKYTAKKPVKCDVALAYWNFFLAVFSTLGAIRIVPHLLWFSATHTFKDTVCTPPQMMNGDGASGLWCLLFTLSKVIELLDTLFVCLKGRTPIFLHWYHHVTVLSFTWTAYAARHPGVYFIAMNYTVHAVMYSYYFLMAINAKPKWLNPMYITFLQISQMVAGVVITLCGFHYIARDPSTCGVVPHVLYFQGLIYGSYLYLFLEFLIKRFFSSSKKGSSSLVSSLPPSRSAVASNGAMAKGIGNGGQELAAGERDTAVAAPAAAGGKGEGYKRDSHLKKPQ
ncbi:fatty-acyl elongase [Nannochloropsis oceanica]